MILDLQMVLVSSRYLRGMLAASLTVIDPESIKHSNSFWKPTRGFQVLEGEEDLRQARLVFV